MRTPFYCRYSVILSEKLEFVKVRSKNNLVLSIKVDILKIFNTLIRICFIFLL